MYVMLIRVFEQIEDAHVKMERTKTKLCGYGGTNIQVEGKIKVMCEFGDAKQKSEFYLVTRIRAASISSCTEEGTKLIVAVATIQVNMIHTLHNICYYCEPVSKSTKQTH